MSEQQQTQQIIERHLFKLGHLMNELSTWIWLSIFLFWLVFPLVFLIIREIQFLIELNKLSKVVKDYDLERAFLFHFIGAIVTATAFFAGWIVLIIGYHSLETWAKRYAGQYPSPNLDKFIGGLKTTKIGLITFPLVVGLFIIPIGMSNAGKALVDEYGGYNTSIQTESSQSVQINSKVPTQEVTGFKPKFCAACGSPVENGLKFCKNCGTPL